ncbi:MAG: GNAT family N-acetyltransferase [Candidatus Limnocylindria bacterium]
MRERAGDPGGTSGPTEGIVVRPLGRDTLDDFLAFFDDGAFADNDWWAGCWCFFFHSPGDEWDASRRAAPAHRERKVAHILAGRSCGHLAYVAGRTVGWVNAAPRESYENPRRFASARDGTEGVGAVMCFVVAAAHRGKGVATALLEAACEQFRRDGLRYAEGYPRIGEARDEWETFATMNYHGPLALYERAGFEMAGEIGHYAVMRKRL